MVLRNDLAGNPTLREVLRRAREMALGAYAHQDLPFDRVVDAVSPVRSLSRNPLFGVVVHVREELPADQVIDTGPDGETRFTALEPTFDVAHADLSLNFFAPTAPAGYQGTVIYRTELYRAETARTADRLAAPGRSARSPTIPSQTLRDITVVDADEGARIVAQWSRRRRRWRVCRRPRGADRVYVLDEWLAPVAVGVVGDVYYAGGAIDESSKPPAAAADPVRAEPVRATVPRLYRTGDRARWNRGRHPGVRRTRGAPRWQAALEAVPGVAAATTRYWETRSGAVLGGYRGTGRSRSPTTGGLHRRGAGSAAGNPCRARRSRCCRHSTGRCCRAR